MDAIVSGSSGLAVLLEGERISSITVFNPSDPIPQQLHELRYLFGDARDFVFLEDVDEAVVRGELESGYAGVCVLHLALMLCDPRTSEVARTSAAEELNDLVARVEAAERAERVLEAKPIPKGFDLGAAISICSRPAHSLARAFLKGLEERQPMIAEVREAWDSLPASLFDTGEDRQIVDGLLVREGFFRSLVRTLINGSNIQVWLESATQNPALRRLGQHQLRIWLIAWVSRLLSAAQDPLPSPPQRIADSRSKPRSRRSKKNRDRTSLFLERTPLFMGGSSLESVSRTSGGMATGLLHSTAFFSEEKALQDGLFMTAVGPDGFSTVSLPKKGVLLIGRGAEADVRIGDPQASRVHCRLYLDDGAIEVEDLESANGTLLHNRALQPGVRAPIVPGDALIIGATLLMLRSAGERPRAVRVLPHGYFLARLDEECAGSARGRSPFALVRLDVEGNLSTSRCAGLLSAILQPSDIIGAYGPRQYELLLPRTTPAATTMLLAELAASFAKAGIPYRTGVAHHPTDGRSGAELLGCACEGIRPASGQRGVVSNIVLADPVMRDLYRLARDAAQSSISVLIVGETGTGKEMLAEVVHRASPRSGKELLSLNCAALPETLIEAELFGYEKNAFTGATQAKPGLLETVPGSTVFLDEIGELPFALQAKLLRVIDTRTLIRVGGVAKRPVDVRFVSATNCDLQRAVDAGQFRPDLYFRLNGITLKIPPLRERHSEIEPFAQRFAGEMAREMGRSTPVISADAFALLHAYAWPGNIRELRNVICRAVLLCATGAEITPDHLPRELMEATFSAPSPALAVSFDRVPLHGVLSAPPMVEPAEKRRILDALAKAAGNQTAAAKLLGIGRTAFVGRLNQYGISRPRKK